MWTGTREDGKDGKQELRPTKPDVGQAPAAGTMCGTKRVAPEKAALKKFARRPPDINAGKPPAGGGMEEVEPLASFIAHLRVNGI